MTKRHTEAAFEDAIESSLLERGGYVEVDGKTFDTTPAIFPRDVVSFVKDTQPKEWAYLEGLHGERSEQVLLDHLCRALDSEHEGCLSVLRHGFKCVGKRFRVAFFAPASGMNPDTQKLYEANKLGVTRQLVYSGKHGNSLDVTLSLNGLPIATLELKNPTTGQTWKNAKKQYQFDRDPTDLIFEFKKRSLVHFAVDPDEVYMCTRLNRSNSVFLPFNRGCDGGGGNPLNPDGYATAYLWEQVLERHSLMDILARFIHLQVEEKKLGAKTVKKETMIFPRFHQLDCVRKIVAHSQERGTGNNYLVQHSAGSGKSNSIAWLAHRLATLYDKNDDKVFDSVIVVTDRVVLDQQLQNTIYQFEHKQGVVEKIEKDSGQLAAALESGTPIIITTLQKFPYAAEKMESLSKRRYGVIIDEAHSSQGGETATEMKGVLSGAHVKEEAKRRAGEEGATETQEEILRTMLARGKQPNVSFFAFTATPKYKTLEVFGQVGGDGKPQPFHLYSMRQAIDEGFIVDVLEHYVTYKTYYRLIKSIEDDPKVEKRKASRALARFMSLHPHNISQKTQVMVEHFWNVTRHKLGGRAKAMVVTASRLHAVRYKREFDRYIAEKGYTEMKTLVAFSGTVIDPDLPGEEFTETGMNKNSKGQTIKEKELPEYFGTDEFQVLLVAEKYQTGFDQPLLHTMFVDKRLAGIQAVQTLSRLNRMAQGKSDTFVLDFVNEAEEIRLAFQPFYEQTTVGEQADPQQLYELQSKLDAYQVYHRNEIEAFANIFFLPKAKQTKRDQGKLNACIDPAKKRFQALEEEEQEAFRKELTAYRNLYSFMSQVMPYQDEDLEKLYAFVRWLLPKLPKTDRGPAYKFDDDVALKYYRLQKTSDGAIQLQAGGEVPISGPTSVGTGSAKADEVELSTLIDRLNERFGTEFTEGDQLFFESIREDALQDEELEKQAKANTLENFGFAFDKVLERLFIDRMEQNEEITAKFMNEEKFRSAVSKQLLEEVYKSFRGEDEEAA